MKEWLMVLWLFANSTAGYLQTMDDGNYVSILKGAISHNLSLVCIAGNQQEKAESIQTFWLDISTRYGQEWEFAYCNSYDTSALMRNLRVNSFPALMVFSNGFVYHAQSPAALTSFVYVTDFLANYLKLNHRATQLPEEIVRQLVPPIPKQPGAAVGLSDWLPTALLTAVKEKVKAVFSDFSQAWTWLGLIILAPVFGGILCVLCCNRKPHLPIPTPTPRTPPSQSQSQSQSQSPPTSPPQAATDPTNVPSATYVAQTKEKTE